MDEITSTKLLSEFNKCVKEQVLNVLIKICEKNKLNYVEIVEEFGLTNETKINDYKPKNKRTLKIPVEGLRCEAIISEGEQCKRSKKDGTHFCRRHKHKQQYGTIHTVEKTTSICHPVIQIPEQEDTNDVEIEYNGNIITLEDGSEVVYVPSNGKCYTYTTPSRYLGKLSSDNKYIIKDEL